MRGVVHGRGGGSVGFSVAPSSSVSRSISASMDDDVLVQRFHVAEMAVWVRFWARKKRERE